MKDGRAAASSTFQGSGSANAGDLRIRLQGHEHRKIENVFA